ncbi:MAG: MBL fold metallo-hydrolase [Verrucomicrobiota bacterium]|jgi:beta-lactamase superfamily II metal-dependent hydrolase|nr:MBL fold metallo-hydrolase [Verrucomicrobiota bacterium]
MKTRQFIQSISTVLALTVAGPATAKDSQTLDVYWVDVEGGGGTLIVTPAGESILIDTGMPGGRDPGRIHKAATEVAGVKQIDHLIVTHFHIDHFGGAAELSQKMPIKNVWDNGIPERDPDGRANSSFLLRIKPYRNMSVSKRHVIQPDTELPLKQVPSQPEVRVRCMAAMQKFVDAPKGTPRNPLTDQVKLIKEDTTDNANSIAVVVELGGFRFWDGGDLTQNTEARLVTPHNRVGNVDVYQVNHHGLDYSNNAVFVRSLAPTVSVMNNGVTKGCGPASFAAVKGAGVSAMYQLHKNLRADVENNTADEFIANLTRDCNAHHIHMSVAPDGRKYTISIPGNGHSRTYETREK